MSENDFSEKDLLNLAGRRGDLVDYTDAQAMVVAELERSLVKAKAVLDFLKSSDEYYNHIALCIKEAIKDGR